MIPPVPVWLIIVNDFHYPSQSTGDWHPELFDVESKAREYFNKIKLRPYQTAYLIRIYGTAYNEIDYREAQQA